MMDYSADRHGHVAVTYDNHNHSDTVNDPDMAGVTTLEDDYNCVPSANTSYAPIMGTADSNWLVECSNITLTMVDLTTETGVLVVPQELTFNDDSLVSIIAYSFLLCISATGNLLVFVTLFRNRHRKSRVNLFIMHLSIADMIVTFIMMPLEIGWHITVAWKAGDLACRVLMFFRAFGFYLSSSILIAISLDRFFAITQPLSLGDAGKRAKIMLILAWMFSACASVPQSVIFHVESHPTFPWFTQCVTFNFFPSTAHELAYNLFNMLALYLAPLAVILVSYTLILCEITKKTHGNLELHKNRGSGRSASGTEKECEVFKSRGSLRRSGMSRIEKARIRTLKMTIVIVSVFVACWTPYFVMIAWWWIDSDSAAKVHTKVQRGLFLFAVSNSCVNPIIYGMFTHTFSREIKRWWTGATSKSTGNGLHVVYQPDSRRSHSSHHKHPLSCLKHPKEKITTPLLARKSPSSSDSNKNNRKGAAGVPCVVKKPIAQDIVCAACAVAITPQASALFVPQMAPLERQNTPPHIAQGRGNKANFEAFLLL